MTFQSFPIETGKKGDNLELSLGNWGIFLLMSPGIGSPWKKGVLRQDEDRVNYMESPFGQAMGWLAKAQKNPEFEAHLPFFGGFERRVGMEKGDDSCDAVFWEGVPCFEGVSQVF